MMMMYKNVLQSSTRRKESTCSYNALKAKKEKETEHNKERSNSSLSRTRLLINPDSIILDEQNTDIKIKNNDHLNMFSI